MRIGINGFGRIGRNFLRACLSRAANIEVVAINDLAAPDVLAHLFKYDSTLGTYAGDVSVEGTRLKIDGRLIEIRADKKVGETPWQKLGADLVLESTGLFTQAAQARGHIDAGGASKIIISAPAQGEDLTVVVGVNDQLYDAGKHHIVSAASCTTNCLATALRPLIDAYGWQRGFMSTVHAYTKDQNLLDAPHADLRRARSAATNIIPTSSGAAKALWLAVPEVKGCFEGLALRVPTATVSMCYVVYVSQKAASREALNETLAQAARTGPLCGILGYSDAPLVSSDFRGSPFSASVDAKLTESQGDLNQLALWYDNEWGYACRLVDLVGRMAQQR